MSAVSLSVLCGERIHCQCKNTNLLSSGHIKANLRKGIATWPLNDARVCKKQKQKNFKKKPNLDEEPESVI